MEFSKPSTSNSISCAAEFGELNSSNSVSCVTPEQVRPLPKAKPRTSKRGGRKPGRCRILTDTPEKKEIEEQHAIKMAKRKRKIIKKPVYQIEEISSEELSDIAEFSDFTDDASFTVADIYDTIEKGDFCLTRLQGKKTEHFYVAEIIDIKGEQYNVKYLKKIAHTNKFLYEKDVYEIENKNIVFKLPKPKSVGGSERQCMQLTFGISFSNYNVE